MQFRHADLHKLLVILGYEAYATNKSVCLKYADRIKSAMAAGDIVKVERGLYQMTQEAWERLRTIEENSREDS